MRISYVLISRDADNERSIMSEIKKIDSVKEITQVMGSDDSIVKLEKLSSDNLSKTISSKIKTVDKVRTTLTLPTMREKVKRKVESI